MILIFENLEELKTEYERLKGADMSLMNDEYKDIHWKAVIGLLGKIQDLHMQCSELLPLVCALSIDMGEESN